MPQVLEKLSIKELTHVRENFLAKVFTSELPKVQNITYWEELTCLGYYPELSELEAVVSIKRPTGYCGGLCANGSTEYVRFFVDWKDGKGFQDAGMADFKAYDISDAPPGPQHPLHYLAKMALDVTTHQDYCLHAVLPKVRAVLSWNTAPSSDPFEMPLFGNELEADIQLETKVLKPISTILDKGTGLGYVVAKLATAETETDLETAVPRVALIDKSLLQAYRKAKVPDQRTLYSIAAPMLSTAKATAFQEAVMADVNVLKEMNVNLEKVMGEIQSTQANISFEELACLGLNSHTDTLGAVIHVKKPCGYNGDLCKWGSKEHVAFWIDWNNDGNFTYLDTVSIRVHDISSIPAEGLYYAVELPIDPTAYLEDCRHPNIVKVRSVLSWSSKPSDTDPDDLNTWGNRMDALVQIRPGKRLKPTELGYRLDYIGNVLVTNINVLANPSTIHDTYHNRPWGGKVNFRGKFFNSEAAESVFFRMEYEDSNIPGSWVPVNTQHTFVLLSTDVNGDLVASLKPVNSADYGGWFPYLADYVTDPYHPVDIASNVLAYWNTGALEGEFKVRLSYYHKNTPLNVIHSNPITITLDNTFFGVNPDFGSVVDPAYTLDIVIDGGDCKTYPETSTVQGHLRVVDQYFGKWLLNVQPSSHVTGSPVFTPAGGEREVSSLIDEGDTNAAWSLSLSNLDPCGYTVRLRGVKRTIFNSETNIFHHMDKYVGFCVTEGSTSKKKTSR